MISVNLCQTIQIAVRIFKNCNLESFDCPLNEIKENTESEKEVSADTSKTDSEYPFPWTLESMRKAQSEDLCVGAIIKWIERGIKPKWSEISDLPEEAKQLLGSWKLLFLENNLLYRRWIDVDSNKELIQLVILQSIENLY